MTIPSLWQAKMLARIHDPAEKAIILMNTSEGHEGGTVAALKKQLYSESELAQLNDLIKKADHWAAGADRPSLPKGYDWNVNFLDAPTTIIHPLSGERFNVEGLGATDIAQLKADSLSRFTRLIQSDSGNKTNFKKTYLANWRFGAEGKMANDGWGALWEQLPAETRIPDHTIWSHLDLTSAFAGAMRDEQGNNDTPVLFSMQFGPVQDFIAQARSTSDLWAGSHLLSRLTWEGIKTLCHELGPDSVLIPQLRGVAIVDAWLYEEQGLPIDLFKQAGAEWTHKNDDTNPLFAAALPNKFTALVPKSRVSDLAAAIEKNVREWVRNLGHDMLAALLTTAGENPDDENLPCWDQLKNQLEGFPECYWAAVPFDLVATDNNDRANVQQSRLAEIQGSFIPHGRSFLDTKIWKDILSKDLVADGYQFWQPNAGVLFPAIYELLERLAASSKQTRTFNQLKQEGFRCTLTGEVEWLTTDRAQLNWTNRQRAANVNNNQDSQKTLWMRVAGKYGIKQGEHLGALGMIKRLWPSFFAQQVGKLVHGENWKARRYVVSTHAMSLAPALARLADTGLDLSVLEARINNHHYDPVILPTRLTKMLRQQGESFLEMAKILPSVLDDDRSINQTDRFLSDIESVLGVKCETYYAIFFMDGDNMGAWLTGGNETEEAKYGIRYQDSFHPKIQSAFNAVPEGTFKNYLKSYRAVSPARHLAVSGALNSFALHLARYVVEECYMGKLFYAGGDDVMAMVAVKDLLPCIYSLRLAYSGVYAAKDNEFGQHMLNHENMVLGGGHALLNGHLYRTMGHKATASVGAVIAHSTAPLQHVLGEVRKMEKTAKESTNLKGESRDAFAIKVLKRAGGAVSMSGKWLLDEQVWGDVKDFDAHLQNETLAGNITQQHKKLFHIESSRMGLIMRLVDVFGKYSELSRKLAYVVQDWLPQLPQLHADSSHAEKAAYVEQLNALLSYQLKQQGLKADESNPMLRPKQVSKDILNIAGASFDDSGEFQGCPTDLAKRVMDALSVTEFLGRENRHAKPKSDQSKSGGAAA